MDSKFCGQCGIRFKQPLGVKGERWRLRQFCTAKCQKLALKQYNTGRPKPFSPEAKAKIALNISRYISKETLLQKQERLKRSYETRLERDGHWAPPKHLPAERSHCWLGDNATYNSKHKWIQKHWVKTGICEHCGLKKLPKPGGRLKHHNHWANISGKYLRVREDWLELCSKCHRLFDNR